MHLPEASNGLAVAQAVSERLPKNLSRSAVMLYQVVYALAVERAQKENYSSGVTHVTMHSSLMAICKTIGISRMQGNRLLKILKEFSLIDYRVQKGMLFGATRNTGIVIQVRMNPLAGSKPRLSYQDLKHSYRDMNRDAKRKRMCHTLISGMLPIKDQEISSVNFRLLVDWSLTPFTGVIPVSHIGNIGLEAVLDVKNATRKDRSAAVDSGAKALAAALRDASSLDWYRRLLWQCLRRIDTTGQDHTYAVYLAAQRAKIDVLEQFARKGGALFQSRLKSAEWFEGLINAPPTRVGMKPVMA